MCRNCETNPCRKMSELLDWIDERATEKYNRRKESEKEAEKAKHEITVRLTMEILDGDDV